MFLSNVEKKTSEKSVGTNIYSPRSVLDSSCPAPRIGTLTSSSLNLSVMLPIGLAQKDAQCGISLRQWERALGCNMCFRGRWFYLSTNDREAVTLWVYGCIFFVFQCISLPSISLSLPHPLPLSLSLSLSVSLSAVRLHDSISEEGFHYLLFDL